MKITIIDYGMGNIKSIIGALKYLGVKDITVSSNLSEIASADKLILPGVGSFSAAMGSLNESGLAEYVRNQVKTKRPLIGICVGMQLLANTGYEKGKHNGLGWIEGDVKKLPKERIKLPHMGWNEVIPKKTLESNIFIEENNYYFVHSYYFACEDINNILGHTNYGIDFASIVSKENIYGVQFHPEKSSNQGLNLIKSFIQI
mgnify:CR=1 FL=1